MRRWLWWLVPVLALSAMVYASRSSSPQLLKDTDTVALIHRLREVKDPTAWFRGDWPLQNHFYRPVSTLAFEWDNARSGDDPAGYGATNALLAALCVLLSFWVFRELTDTPWFAFLATLLFALWHSGETLTQPLAVAIAWLGPLCLIGLFRGGPKMAGKCLAAWLACYFLSESLRPVSEFAGRIVDWLPGRTASVMCVFAFAAVAAYARYVRLSGKRIERKATAEDLPATKSTQVVTAKYPWVWVVVALLCTVLALGSYEQAVMLPGLFVGVQLLFLLRGTKSSWMPHIAFWALLFAYLALRRALVPSDVSGYQAQQFRTGAGVWIVLGQYSFPAVFWAYTAFQSFVGGVLILLTGPFWAPISGAAGNFVAYVQAWRDDRAKWWFVGFLAMSFVAFLPMAWLKPFGHYHYLPSLFRAGYVVALAMVVARLVATAVSLPDLRAPARQSPAPGSLLRQ
ncbi:MAG TPA: hypothetical protein VNI20_11200 [Fimbriimonadaceae bacterium]|nr:hypothetical protein [Fimbriimonadaceae bacterium]